MSSRGLSCSQGNFVTSGWWELSSCRAMPRLKQLQQLAQANAAAGGDQAQAGAATKGTPATKPAAAKDAKVRRWIAAMPSEGTTSCAAWFQQAGT